MKNKRILLISLISLFLTGCSQTKTPENNPDIYEENPMQQEQDIFIDVKTNIEPETQQEYSQIEVVEEEPEITDKGYSINLHEGETFYIIEKDYEKEEYSIQEIFSSNYPDNEYPEQKTSGEILNYQEYIDYCNLMNIEPQYTDDSKNYLILSYGSRHGWTDFRLADVEYDNENITLYVWEDVQGVMGSSSGYVFTLPTNCTSEYTIDINLCITQEWFEIITNEEKYDTYMREMTLDKPVIYLYPEKMTTLDVSLDLKGTLEHTYPKYEDKWTVTAMPDGTLFDKNGRMYNYLFWEGKSDTEFDMSEGFCIKGTDTLEFLEETLTKLGLSYLEQCDFISYWLPLMENNPYNIISFQKESYTNIAKINTSEKIDTEIRVFMCFKPSKTFVNIKEQTFETPERKGFTLVEWGGTILH